jgi:phage terminase Nu1 subunit (DNA packaging protein)
MTKGRPRKRALEAADDDWDWLEGQQSDPTVTDKHGLATMLGFAPKDVDRFIREGLPVRGDRKRGQTLQFSIPAAAQWLLAQAGDTLEFQKRRMTTALARKREAEAAKLEGGVVDIDLVESVIRDQVAKYQAEFESIPARVPPEVRELVRAEIHGVINRLAFKVRS